MAWTKWDTRELVKVSGPGSAREDYERLLGVGCKEPAQRRQGIYDTRDGVPARKRKSRLVVQMWKSNTNLLSESGKRCAYLFTVILRNVPKMNDTSRAQLDWYQTFLIGITTTHRSNHTTYCSPQQI